MRGKNRARAEAIWTGCPSHVLAWRSSARRMPSPDRNHYNPPAATATSTIMTAPAMSRTRFMEAFICKREAHPPDEVLTDGA